jgi:hypothetical protein
MTTTLALPKGTNLNTWVQIVGFLGIFATVIAAWSNLQNEQRNFGAFIEEQKTFNGRIEERFRTGAEKLAQFPVLQADMTRVEAANVAQDDRMSRMADSNGTQLADLRASAAQLATQVALIKQSLDRIEVWASTPAGRRQQQ